MKTPKCLLMIAALIILCQISYGQENCTNSNQENITALTPLEYQYTCKTVSNDLRMRVTTLLDVDSFKNSNVEFCDAEKIIINRKDKKVTVFGCKNYKTTGAIVVAINNDRKAIIEYTLGDDVLYIR